MKAHTENSYDAIVVGSGPGGAAVARVLAARGRRVLILEQGSAAPLRGTLGHMASIAAIPGKGAFIHGDLSLLVQGLVAGGSTAINFATAAPPPFAMFDRYGIDLRPSHQQLQEVLPMAPLPDSLVGPMAARIMQGARALKLDWRKLDKLIRPSICRTGCWRCLYGCPFGAKWTARDFIDEAVQSGAVLMDNARAERILVGDGAACGVEFSREGRRQRAMARHIVTAAGGIGTPRLLHRSGLHPRYSPFFSDPVIAVMGHVDDIGGGAEVPMAAGLSLETEGVALADMTLPGPMFQAFAAQRGRFDRLSSHRGTLTLMVKIRDDIGGRIGPLWVNKRLQSGDRARLRRGEEMARAILEAAGARSQFSSHHFAAHPGGSVRIGAGVDSDLQSATRELYACDASVIPEAWGRPPTLTLLCLGQRLGEHLAQ